MINMGVILGFRVEDKEAELLRDVTKARGEDLSDFIRRAVFKELAELGYLPNERKKALGSNPIEAVSEAMKRIEEIVQKTEEAQNKIKESVERVNQAMERLGFVNIGDEEHE